MEFSNIGTSKHKCEQVRVRLLFRYIGYLKFVVVGYRGLKGISKEINKTFLHVEKRWVKIPFRGVWGN